MSQSYAAELNFMFAAASVLWLDTPAKSNQVSLDQDGA